MINAIFFYRIGNFCYRNRIPLIPLLCKFFIRVIYNSAVDCSTRIGKGSTFSYGGIAVIVHKNAVIGENVTIGPHVVIGGRSRKVEVPVIGNSVYIGAGAKVLGDIVIGEGVVIGANSVVLQSVPANTIVAGVPARIIKENIQVKDFV